MEETSYFISAFLEIESIKTNTYVARDLKRVGNLFATQTEAIEALKKVTSLLNNGSE